MDTVVYGGLLTRTEFAQLLEKCTFLHQGTFLGEDFPLHLVSTGERDRLIRFIRFDSELSYDMYAQYTTGRIFHTDFELRWLPEAEKVRVLYIGTEQEIPFLAIPEYPELEERAEQQSYYLFGERLKTSRTVSIGRPVSEEDLAEARIPRLLHYPLGGEKHYVQLVVQEYLEKATRQVALYRFVAVKEA